MEARKINYYLIPGMGADHRLYEHCKLQHGNVHYLNWLPAGKSKNLSEYAEVLANEIKTENNIIVGSSMGGMVSVELARKINPLAAILISAPTGRHEFPRVLKVFDQLRIHRLVRPNQIMRLSRLADLFMGFKTPEQRALFYDMLKDNGPEFLHFSVNAVLGWKNQQAPECPFIQILGTEDRLFKTTKIKNAICIKGSGHFTAYEKAQEVSRIINEYVEQNILPKI
jgi:pimeloyl-ACP methyl ester carboxylesterase